MSKLYLGNKFIIDPNTKLEKVSLTLAEYDALTEKKDNILYVITDAPNPYNKLVEIEEYFNTHKNNDKIHVPTGGTSGLVLSKDTNGDLTWSNVNSSSSYTLPTASTTVKGGVKVGNGLNITNEVLSANLSIDNIPNLTWNKITSGKPTTLAGYGITNAYTKTESDNKYLTSVTKTQIGLGNVTNDAQVKRAEMGIANGVAQLDASGKVPAALLPSYVDDVLEYADFSSFPTTGESGKIYVAKNTNLTYRWGGTNYVEISASIALGETASTAYAGDKGKATTDKVNSHVANKSNPHEVTKAQVGLGNVDNTSDANKPVSTAMLTALNGKVDKVTGKGLSTNDFTDTYKNLLDNLIDSGNIGIGSSNKVSLSVNSTVFNNFIKTNPFNNDFSIPINSDLFNSLVSGDVDTIKITNITSGDSQNDFIKLIITHYDNNIPLSGNSALYFMYRWHLSTNLTDPDSGIIENANGHEILFGYILDTGLVHIYGTTIQ